MITVTERLRVESLPMIDDETAAQTLVRLLDGMRDYIESGEAEYDERHVVECEAILNDHATAMRAAGDGRAALEVVRATVAFIIRVGYVRVVGAALVRTVAAMARPG